MKKKAIISLIFLTVSLTASNIFLIVQHLKLKSEVSANANEIFKRLSEHLQCVDIKFEDIKSNVQTLMDSHSRDVAEIQGTLAFMRKRADAQFSETVGIKETYDNILEEQKKKTVDFTLQDSAMQKTKENAEKYYSENNFALAYKEFKKVLEYQHDDMECRLKKMKSLYYMNRADSSKYSEILEDIRILKSDGYADSETIQIEALINAEREGFDE